MRFGRREQAGFLMPVAVFILVALSLLALAASHIMRNSSHSSLAESVSVQAFYAADSAAQYGLNQILFPDANQATGDSRCSSLDGSSLSLLNCQAALSCSQANDSTGTISYYRVQSSATCGAGELTAERIVTVAVKL